MTDKAAVAETPVSPEVFPYEVIEAITRLDDQAKRIRAGGSIPAHSFFELNFAEPIHPEMSEHDRYRLIKEQHDMFMRALANSKLAERIIRPQPVTVEWEEGSITYQAFFTRLTKDMALMEYVYKGTNGKPLQYRPTVVVGKDALEKFVKENMWGEDFMRAHMS